MKNLTRIIVFIIILLMFPYTINAGAYSGTFMLFQKAPSGKHYGLYNYDNVMYLYDKSGENYEKYTGFAKTKNGDRRYYVTGHICKGWRKIGEKWYYFDYSKGNAATGAKIIGGKKYVFNSDGSWSGKRSKSAAYPSDFSVKLTFSGMDGKTSYLIDGKSKTLKITADDGAVTTKKMSKADIQAFYSMISDSGITDIKAPVSGFYIENNYLLTGYTPPVYENEEDEPDDPADTDYWWTDPEILSFEITSGGESYSIIGDDTAFLFAFTDKVASGFCNTIWMFTDYVASMKK